jgi:predicted deacylase
MTITTSEIAVGHDIAGRPVFVSVRNIVADAPGPRLLVTAAIHGDEIIGVEIIRRFVDQLDERFVAGRLILVPAVNVLGLLRENRGLPGQINVNRRMASAADDSYLNRVAGAARDLLGECDAAIDLHSGRKDSEYLPHLRTDFANAACRKMALAFGCPVVLDRTAPPGSFRSFAQGRGIPMITFESGEALRFDSAAIAYGVDGIRNVMSALQMVGGTLPSRPALHIAKELTWVRVPESGLLVEQSALGARVNAGQPLGFVFDVFGRKLATVSAPVDGIVIGRATLPLVYSGERIFVIAHD